MTTSSILPANCELVNVKNYDRAIIGFSDWSQLESIRNSCDSCEVVSLKLRDGEHAWTNEGTMWEPYKLDADDFGIDAQLWGENDAVLLREFVSSCLTNCETIADMAALTKAAAEVEELLSTCGDNFKVLTVGSIANGGEVVDTRPMHYRHDVYKHEIGIILLDDDDDDDDDNI